MHCAGCVNVNVAVGAHDQCTNFSTGGKFRPDYGLLLELHALTLVVHYYVLLLQSSICHPIVYNLITLVSGWSSSLVCFYYNGGVIPYNWCS